MHPDAWLVVIDPQRIFADPASPWGSAMFPDIVEPVRRLAAAAGERTVVTRWVPARDPQGSWRAYLDAWPFADVPDDDPLLDLVPEAHGLSDVVVSLPTFGKWGPELAAVTGPVPHLVLTGVSTDCCVVSTALAAADAGATVTVVTDGCAGSSADNQRAALQVMDLYPPQITLATTDEVLGS
ncbi:cysteine hydrolase family protein [Nocardioides sp. zg-1228]|uniref:cysteine hydrolase family protein n=1 Tax=Nocardioides sp. zg-1228 TaxID=2763008 RepID=UPI00164287D3|nr:isochorismatase family protein [Nocardioides sp. zg-1228]MBC2931755.1 isochorismatase family protein [Nocardioides sp. zg-1228]QSF57338.1 isochorismatase family protein [Nocardioides sp. zg-1228]